MLIAVISGPSEKELIEQIDQANSMAEGVEIRWDLLEGIEEKRVALLLKRTALPKIFTLRKASQGGGWKGSEKQREKKILSLLFLEPDYFDLEYDTSVDFLSQLPAHFPKTEWVCSYHNFKETPLNLTHLLLSMQKPFFSIYKIAVHSQSIVDTLRMMVFVREVSSTQRMVGISMGKWGEATRILGPVLGNIWDYALPTPFLNPLYQLDLVTLKKIYRYSQLTPKTKIYALLGDPVDRSIGHLFHNNWFTKKEKEGIYLKLEVKKEELSSFFTLSSALPFAGYSVTMPLKEAVIPYLHKVEEERIGAVNTLIQKDKKLYGSNTDGEAALDLIEEKGESVKGKTLLVLGGGGSARAVIFSALRRGAKVWVWTRDEKKGKKVVEEMNCEGFGYRVYDVVVQTTPMGESLVIEEEKILEGKIALEFIYSPKETAFIKAAKKKNCSLIYGEEVFISQAIKQQKKWEDKNLM